MSKAVIIYGTTTGTTQEMAKIVEQQLLKNGFDVVARNASNTDEKDIIGYDLIVLGCSTWGDGELQDDFIPFEEKLRSLDLSGKKAAVFGPGESMYPQFCKSVEVLEGTLKNGGAELVVEGLKVDVSKGDFTAKVGEWVKRLSTG